MEKAIDLDTKGRESLFFSVPASPFHLQCLKAAIDSDHNEGVSLFFDDSM